MTKQHLIIAVIGLVVLVGGGLAAAGRGGEGTHITSLATDSVARLFNAECRYNDPELCKFMNNWKMPSEYSMRSTMTAKNTPTTEFESKMKGEDTHIIMKEAGKVTHESIRLSGAEYLRDLSDGTWWKLTKEVATKQPVENTVKVAYDFTEKMEEIEDKTTYVYLSKETCGNSECFKYQVVDPRNTSTREFISFDDEDYLIRIMRSEEIGGTMAVSVIATTYEKVTIDTPSPVKEGTALDAYGAASGMSKAEIADLKKQQAEAEQMSVEYMKNIDTGSMNMQMDSTWEMPPEEVDAY